MELIIAMRTTFLRTALVAIPLIALGGCTAGAENEVPEEKKEVFTEERVPSRSEICSKAIDCYTGSNGVPQNYKKAEELFRQSAEMGSFSAPAYISALLEFKLDRSPENTKRAIARECYFWTLIALSYSSTSQRYREGRAVVFFSLQSKKEFFEKNLTLNELEQIQDQATKWCEEHKRY